MFLFYAIQNSEYNRSKYLLSSAISGDSKAWCFTSVRSIGSLNHEAIVALTLFRTEFGLI